MADDADEPDKGTGLRRLEGVDTEEFKALDAPLVKHMAPLGKVSDPAHEL